MNSCWRNAVKYGVVEAVHESSLGIRRMLWNLLDERAVVEPMNGVVVGWGRQTDGTNRAARARLRDRRHPRDWHDSVECGTAGLRRSSDDIDFPLTFGHHLGPLEKH